MKIVSNPYNPGNNYTFDTSIYVESPDELTEVKTMIDTFIYHSVNEEMETKIVVFYKDIKIQIDTYYSEKFTYFNIKTPLIDINLDKKDLPLKRICKLIYKQFLLAIKYGKANNVLSKSIRKEVEVL